MTTISITTRRLKGDMSMTSTRITTKQSQLARAVTAKEQVGRLMSSKKLDLTFFKIPGLRSIAQGSADQASSAVTNQHLAAKQASYIAQNNLANLALQASATAMAALQGKQVLLAKIEQENLDAHQQLEVELQQLKQSKRSAKAAQQVALI